LQKKFCQKVNEHKVQIISFTVSRGREEGKRVQKVFQNGGGQLPFAQSKKAIGVLIIKTRFACVRQEKESWWCFVLPRRRVR
jgi:hypothetical protein